MLTKKFNDVESRVKHATGFLTAQNSIIMQMNQDHGFTNSLIDIDRAERAIRKQHAKFYGLDNKYDGNGNLRELPYKPIDKFGEVAA